MACFKFGKKAKTDDLSYLGLAANPKADLTAAKEEFKKPPKWQRILVSTIFTGGFSIFAVGAILSTTIGSLSINSSLLEEIGMYLLGSLGSILVISLIFFIAYWMSGKKPTTSSCDSNELFPKKRESVSFFDNSAYCGLRGNKYNHRH